MVQAGRAIRPKWDRTSQGPARRKLCPARFMFHGGCLVLSCLPLHAQEQADSPRRWLEVGQGIVCNLPEQVERFVALRGNGMDVIDALQTVNQEFHDSTACDVSLVAFTDCKPIADRLINGKLATIIQIIVQAVGNGTTWRTILAHRRYTVEVKEGQIV
jgi:hypothetical protein